MTNPSDRPLGALLPHWQPRQKPDRRTRDGDRCRLPPLSPDEHAEDLWHANAKDSDGRMWDYMSNGPFTEFAEYRAWAEGAAASDDPLFFAIIDRATDKALGVASYLRIDPANGVIEVGNIAYSPALQGSPLATEAMHLMMAHVFDDLGYRRYEWKCNALNAPSRRAAQRLGFSYEGLFRNHMLVKGRNRDTAWFAITDQDWPDIREAHRAWLSADNFEEDGRQRRRLSALTKPLIKLDPVAG